MSVSNFHKEKKCCLPREQIGYVTWGMLGWRTCDHRFRTRTWVWFGEHCWEIVKRCFRLRMNKQIDQFWCKTNPSNLFKFERICPVRLDRNMYFLRSEKKSDWLWSLFGEKWLNIKESCIKALFKTF